MICPMCKKPTFIELSKMDDEFYMCYGYSIKECLHCEYKVCDKVMDGRFAGLDHVIRKPNVSKLNL